MKKGYLLLLVFFATQTLYAQKIQFSLQSGLGSYSMNDLKIINIATQNNLPFKTQITDDFPAYWYYQPMISINFQNFSSGLLYSYHSAGSRVSSHDYSGEYKMDMLVNSHVPGLFCNFNFAISERMELGVYSEFGVIFSNLKINDYFMVLEQEIRNTSDKFTALHYMIEPGINLTYNLYNNVNIGLNLGYSVQFGNEAFHYSSDKNKVLINQESYSPVKPNWDGIRAGLSISYLLYKL